MKICIIRLDLTTGGGPKLMLDMAYNLIQMGHSVDFYTTNIKDTFTIHKIYDPLIPINTFTQSIPLGISGRFIYFFTLLKLSLLSISLLGKPYDCVITDNEALPLVILKAASKLFNVPCKFIYYCHFPEKLFKSPKKLFLWKLYTVPQMWFEEKCIRTADHVFVNSQYTYDAFLRAYGKWGSNLSILHPVALEAKQFEYKASKKLQTFFDFFVGNKIKILMAFGAFNRMKNFELGIDTLCLLKKMSSTKVRLIIAGACDCITRKSYKYSLGERAISKRLTTCDFPQVDADVIFLTSFSQQDKLALMEFSSCFISTCPTETFGIVPVEVMYMGTPVVAVNKWGTLDSVVDGDTGYLVDETPEEFAKAVKRILEDSQLAIRMGDAGKVHAQNKFSADVFKSRLKEVLKLRDKRRIVFERHHTLLLSIILACLLLYILR